MILRLKLAHLCKVSAQHLRKRLCKRLRKAAALRKAEPPHLKT